MFPAGNVAVAIVNMLAEKFASTIESKGFTVSHYNFSFDWNTTHCDQLPISKALRAGNLDITKAVYIGWRDTSGVLECSFPRASAVLNGDG